jgi:ADP-ribose pyrophosphatase YjhB (NUDIX family)
MTAYTTDDSTDVPDIHAITDPSTLRDEVPFHEDTDVVPEETFEAIRDADDMAPVGVTTDDGETLVMQVTDTCAWKIPSSSVAPEESFADAAREWVRTNTGLEIDIESVAGVWRLDVRLDGSDRTASQHFVVFEASPVSDDPAPPVPIDGDDDRALDAGWFTDLPEDGARVPGTDLFLD